ncbi:MAG: nuclear transport factor 2 family protein [Flavobacteriales bacterium]|nr:nuclear transport factor 2 family protein [Flavobacteriales bacterium]
METPLAVVQRMLGAFGSGNMEELKTTLSTDSTWVYHGPAEVPYAGTYVGKDEVVRFIGTIVQHTNIEGFEVHGFVAEGDKVVVLGREKQHVKKNGLLLDQQWVMVYTVANGLITRLDEFADTANAAKLFTA